MTTHRSDSNECPALKLTWILQGMSMGARLRVNPVNFDPMVYRAALRWNVNAEVWGKPSNSITEAINSLNDALQEDCAREMLEKGQA